MFSLVCFKTHKFLDKHKSYSTSLADYIHKFFNFLKI